MDKATLSLKSTTTHEPTGLYNERASRLRALMARGNEQAALFAQARALRDDHFPDLNVEIRSVIETGNTCSERCRYCAIANTPPDQRFTLDFEQFQRITRHLYKRGRRVLLLQSGEDRSRRFIDHMCRCVAWAKKELPTLTFILCFGNLRPSQYRDLREAGGERYILKFETANPTLYRTIKPGASLSERLECLDSLIELGYEVSTGNMVGVPGQTHEDLLEDLSLVERYGESLSMVSTSIFVPGAGTEYADKPMGDLDTTLNFMALLRILLPHACIPTTSSLEHARTDGQLAGLMAGANTVTIHDGTPRELKALFPIYSERRITPQEEHLRRIVEAAGLYFEPTPQSASAIHPNAEG